MPPTRPSDKLEVHPHQQMVVKHLAKPTTRGIIVNHAVGTGKTITALLTAKAVYHKLLMPSIVVCPPAVVPGFTREMSRVINMGNGNTETYVQVLTPITFLKKIDSTPTFTSGKLLIVDEAHNFRSKDGTFTSKMVQACHGASKVMLLTATPIHNEPMDIVPLLFMLKPFKPSDQMMEYNEFENAFGQALAKYEGSNRKKELVKLLRGNVSVHHTNKAMSSLYPTVMREKVELVMDKEYLREYKMVENNDKSGLPRFMKGKNITVFFNGLRRAANKIRAPSEKINKVVDLIRSHTGDKCVVYSSWKDAGITMVGKALHKAKIEHVYVSGDQSQTEKEKSIDAYNNGSAQVMLISKAGAEGIDLKGTKVVIILEPHWNNELIRQVVGRAVRLKSHEHLPIDQRVVKVYDIVLKKPHSYIGDLLEQIGLYKTDDVPSVDELIKTYADNKDHRIERFNKVMAVSSIEQLHI